MNKYIYFPPPPPPSPEPFSVFHDFDIFEELRLIFLQNVPQFELPHD